MRLTIYMQKTLNLDFFFKLYNCIYMNYYFLKDFFNFKIKNNKDILVRNFKILTFYDKIVSIIFMNLDPFFLSIFENVVFHQNDIKYEIYMIIFECI